MSTSTRQKWILASLSGIAALGIAGFVWRQLQSGIPQSPAAVLPLRCRLLGHGWKKSSGGKLPARHTCPRCESLELPTP